LRVDRPDCCGQAETKNEIEGYSSHATFPQRARRVPVGIALSPPFRSKQTRN
jgi:hypothetical protein